MNYRYLHVRMHANTVLDMRQYINRLRRHGLAHAHPIAIHVSLSWANHPLGHWPCDYIIPLVFVPRTKQIYVYSITCKIRTCQSPIYTLHATGQQSHLLITESSWTCARSDVLSLADLSVIYMEVWTGALLSPIDECSQHWHLSVTHKRTLGPITNVSILALIVEHRVQ